MPMSYKPLMLLLVERDLDKQYLRDAGISPATIAKFSKGEYVSLQVIERICEILDCRVEDVVQYKPNK